MPTYAYPAPLTVRRAHTVTLPGYARDGYGQEDAFYPGNVSVAHAAAPAAPIAASDPTDPAQMTRKDFDAMLFRRKLVAGNARQINQTNADMVHNQRYRYPEMAPVSAAPAAPAPLGPPAPGSNPAVSVSAPIVGNGAMTINGITRMPAAPASAPVMAPVPVPGQDFSAERDIASGGYFTGQKALQGQIDVGIARAEAPIALQGARNEGAVAKERAKGDAGADIQGLRNEGALDKQALRNQGALSVADTLAAARKYSDDMKKSIGDAANASKEQIAGKVQYTAQQIATAHNAAAQAIADGHDRAVVNAHLVSMGLPILPAPTTPAPASSFMTSAYPAPQIGTQSPETQPSAPVAAPIAAPATRPSRPTLIPQSTTQSSVSPDAIHAAVVSQYPQAQRDQQGNYMINVRTYRVQDGKLVAVK